MAVTISWTDGVGTDLADPVDLTSGVAGDNTPVSGIYVRHNGTNPIKNARYYISPVTSGYAGAATAQEDYDEMLAWGDSVVSGDYGGVQVNMDVSDGSPGAWPTVSGKDPDSSYTVRTGFGDSAANGLMLSPNMSTEMSAAGIVPGGITNWPLYQIRVRVPTNEGDTGLRHVSQKLQFTYTS